MSDRSSRISSSPSFGESSLGLPSVGFSSGSSVSSGSPSDGEKISRIQNQLNFMRQKLSETRSRLQQNPLLSKASSESEHNKYNDSTQNNSVLNHQDNSNSNIPITDYNNTTQQNPPPLSKLSLSSSSSSSYYIAVEDILEVSSDTNFTSNPEKVSNRISEVPNSSDENQFFPQSKSKEMLDTSFETHRAQNPSMMRNRDDFHQRQVSSSSSLISDITDDEMISLEEFSSNHSNKHLTPDESLLVQRSQKRLDRLSRVHDNVITMQTENYYLKNINMKLLMQLDSLMREHKELQTTLTSISCPIPEKVISDANDGSQEVDINHHDDIFPSPSSDLQKDSTYNSPPCESYDEIDDLPHDLSVEVLSGVPTPKNKKTISPSAMTTTSSVISFSSATSRSWRNHLERQREQYNITKRKLEEKRVKCRELLIAVQNEQKLKNSKVLCVSCHKSLNKMSSSDENHQHFVVINKLKQKEEEVEQLNLKNQYLVDKYELVHKSLQESRSLHNEDKEIMHQLEMESHRLKATISTLERESALKSKTIESLERQLEAMKMTMEDMDDLHQMEKVELHQYCEELKQEADRLVLWMKANNDQAISQTKSLTNSEEDALLEEIYKDRKMWLKAKNDLDRHMEALADEYLPQQQNRVDNQIDKIISLEVRDVTLSHDSSSLSDSS